ncbi:AraC family transcriptional regulator [Nocardia sp. NBC_00565]|uniref:AraC family transcriptional regulator n=1 Tax=Nocardia sp. NBC_00565 TaxID=2975993 RepID=UPI002E803890|nr:AraC family transcriptional regulator [Nocardia sp. NBC_00565]WUC03361.1 AraC family transcriptional regulator [Nocardia sp. NBC_00565]
MVSLDELRKLIVSHAGCADLAIDGLLLSSRDEPIAPIPGPVLMIVAEGVIRVVFGDRTYEYCAGQYLVASIDLPVIGHYVQASLSEPFVGFGLTFEPEEIAALLLEAGSDTQNRRDLAAGPRPGLAVSDVSSELLDSAVRLLRLLDHRTDLPVLAPIVKKEILWRLITGEQGATVRQLGLADSRLTHVRRAIQWIREHHTETLHIEDLARIAGMSTASFHRHFRAVTAMTPVQFQKQIRLHEARQLLLSEAHDVATTGYLVGYDSPSQFSREYRRLFGAPPGQDAARLRESRATSQ